LNGNTMVPSRAARRGRAATLTLVAVSLAACGQPQATASTPTPLPALTGPTQPSTATAFEAVMTAAGEGGPRDFTMSIQGATGLGGDGTAGGRLDLVAAKVEMSLHMASLPDAQALYVNDIVYVHGSSSGSANGRKPWIAFAAGDPNAHPVPDVIPALVLDPGFLVDELRAGTVEASPAATSDGTAAYDVRIDLLRAEGAVTGPARDLEVAAVQTQLSTVVSGGGQAFMRMRVTLTASGSLHSLQVDETKLGAGVVLLTLQAASAKVTAAPPPADQITDVGAPGSAGEGENGKGKDGDAS
jgi:hypothetical protein